MGGEHALTEAKAGSAWTLPMATDDSFVFGLPGGLYCQGSASLIALGSAKVIAILGTRDYLFQQNWVNASGGYCTKSY